MPLELSKSINDKTLDNEIETYKPIMKLKPLLFGTADQR